MKPHFLCQNWQFTKRPVQMHIVLYRPIARYNVFYRLFTAQKAAQAPRPSETERGVSFLLPRM